MIVLYCNLFFIFFVHCSLFNIHLNNICKRNKNILLFIKHNLQLQLKSKFFCNYRSLRCLVLLGNRICDEGATLILQELKMYYNLF